jgi:hypothetical protein
MPLEIVSRYFHKQYSRCVVTNFLTSEMKIIFDSGIRTGADIFKAIALGAHAVQVGRLYIWGMAHEGEAGCRHVMKSLLAVSTQRSLGRRNRLFICCLGSRYLDDCGGLSFDKRRQQKLVEI